MKLITLFIIFSANLSLAGDQKTVIDQINEADSIPVYISKHKVTAKGYDSKAGGILLTFEEENVKYVSSTFPSEIDSFSISFVASLNAQFDTDKFYFVKAGTHEEIEKEVEELKLPFLVILSFAATYNYEYLAPKVIRDPKSKVLVAHRKVSCQTECAFYNTTENSKLKYIKYEGGYVLDDATFEVKGNVQDVNELMKYRHPKILLEKVVIQALSDIEKLSSKLKKAQIKIEEKRNK